MKLFVFTLEKLPKTEFFFYENVILGLDFFKGVKFCISDSRFEIINIFKYAQKRLFFERI